MLDLDPPVQLEEEELAAAEHELGRSGAAVADRARERDRRLAHLGAQGCVERGGGRLLEHLLMAALDRALALAQGDHVAVCVGEQLDLDVARALEVPLAEDAVVAERGLPPRAGRRASASSSSAGVADDAHAAAAAARGRLDHERVAELLRLSLRNDGHAGLARDPLGLELVAARAERLGRGADEDEPGGLDRLGEVGVLGEEAVAGVDRVGVRACFAARMCSSESR